MEFCHLHALEPKNKERKLLAIKISLPYQNWNGNNLHKNKNSTENELKNHINKNSLEFWNEQKIC